MRGARAVALAVAGLALLAPVAAHGGYDPYPPAPPPPPSEPPPPTTSSSTLTVGLTGDGSGSVSSSPAGIECGSDCSEPYPAGTTVTLLATASDGSAFTGWSGACSGTGQCAVTMTSAQSVTASFAPLEQSQASIADTSVQASVARVRTVVRGARRIVLVTLGAGEKVRADIELRRKNRTLARRSVELAARTTVRLRVPRSTPAGRATVRVALEDAAGNGALVARSLRIPARR